MVEDTILNQEVASEILSHAGMVVDIASNGLEAVEAVSNKAYDLVLMDIQMPVMGGFEATKEIRKNPINRRLPIIAMTAHAVQGAKEQCIRAGMNDFVSKPIDQKQLFSVINNWIDLREVMTGENALNLNKESISLEGISGIDLESGLARMNNNRDFFIKMLLAFEKEYHHIDGDINKSILMNDLEHTKELIHTLRGVAGNISAQRVQLIFESN